MEKSFYGAHQKNLNDILSAAKCMSTILVSRNVRYVRIFVEVPRGGASNDSGVVDERVYYWLLCSENFGRIMPGYAGYRPI